MLYYWLLAIVRLEMEGYISCDHHLIYQKCESEFEFPLPLHLVRIGEPQETASCMTCNTPRPNQRPIEPPTWKARQI